MMDIKEYLLLNFSKFFEKKSVSLTDKSVSGSRVNIPLDFNEQLAKELHKPIIRKI